jgi:hypothetical protein
MDFSVVLVLPLAALIAFIVCVGAAIARHRRPILFWPFALTMLLSAPVFVGFPSASMVGVWSMAIFGLAVWAAIGSVLGALIAKLSLFVVRQLRSI